MNSLIACISGSDMILAMPGVVKHCTKERNEVHHSIMIAQPEATQEEFENLLKQNSFEHPTVVLIYQSLKSKTL